MWKVGGISAIVKTTSTWSLRIGASVAHTKVASTSACATESRAWRAGILPAGRLGRDRRPVPGPIQSAPGIAYAAVRSTGRRLAAGHSLQSIRQGLPPLRPPTATLTPARANPNDLFRPARTAKSPAGPSDATIHVAKLRCISYSSGSGVLGGIPRTDWRSTGACSPSETTLRGWIRHEQAEAGSDLDRQRRTRHAGAADLARGPKMAAKSNRSS
jgi:hypothetical protein